MAWPMAELNTVAEIRGGATPRRDNPIYWNGDIPWVTPTDLPALGEGISELDSTTEAITNEGLASCSARLLPPGTVLFSSRATIGKVGIATVPLATNQGFANFIPKSGVESRYLAWCLHHAADRVAGLAGSTTFKEVSKSSFGRFRIPIPPLSEQRHIVDILDQADRLRRLRAEGDAKAARILPALFIEMFSDPATNPMGWPVRPFDSVCESRLGKMLDQKQQTGRHRRFYLRNANVYWDRLDLREVLEMDFDEADRDEFRLRKGDVLICEGGEVGRCAIWNDELPECYFQKALHRARPFPSTATSEYIVFLFLLLAQRGALLDAASKVTFSHLTGVKLKGLAIPVPPFHLQERFSSKARATKNALEPAALAQDRISLANTVLLNRAYSGTLTA